MRVLLQSPDISMRVQSMSSDQPLAYYACLLRGYVVPELRRALFYQQVLEGEGSLPIEAGAAVA